MNRFFSKLNLHDIKISPEGSKFLPDDDEPQTVEDRSQAPIATEIEPTPEPGIADIDTPSLNEAPSEPTLPGRMPSAEPAVDDAPVSSEEDSFQSDEPMALAAAPVHSNGHAREDLRSTVDYYADSELVVSPDEVLKVSARSRPSAVAGAIAGVVREAGRAEVQAIGAGATNQAVKAVAIARDYLNETGIDAVCVPAFIDVTIDNEDRTAIRLVIEPR